jgi:hypothetical protein
MKNGSSPTVTAPPPVYPLVAPDLAFETPDDRQGTVRLSRPGCAAVEVASSVATIVTAFDGRRSCEEMTRDYAAHGVVLPGPDFLLALAQYFAGQGLVELLGEPVDGEAARAGFLSLHRLNHRCQRSGACCQYHLVEVDAAVMATLPADHAALAEEFPRLGAISPIREVEASGRRVFALAVDEHRRCIYVDTAVGCVLQARFGARRKPLACRMFPLEAIRTGTELRMGFSGACFGLHETYTDARDASPIELTGIEPEEFPSPVSRGMDPRRPSELERAPSPSSSYGQHRALEERAIRLTMAPDATVDDIYRLVVGIHAGPGAVSKWHTLADSGAADVIGRVLRDFGASVSDVFGPEYSAAPAGSLVAGFWSLLTLLRERVEGRPFQGLRPEERDFTFYTLGEWLYLRDWHLQVGLATGLVVRLLGIIVASWVREDVEAGVMEPSSFATPFAFGLTLWARMVRTDTHFARLFETREQVRDLMAELGTR